MMAMFLRYQVFQIYLKLTEISSDRYFQCLLSFVSFILSIFITFPLYSFHDNIKTPSITTSLDCYFSNVDKKRRKNLITPFLTYIFFENDKHIFILNKR